MGRSLNGPLSGKALCLSKDNGRQPNIKISGDLLLLLKLIATLNSHKT